MRKPICLIYSVAAIGLASGPSIASSNQGDASKAKIVCKEEAKTGTRFGKKVCRTKAEWDEIYEMGRRKGAEMLNQPKINYTSEH